MLQPTAPVQEISVFVVALQGLAAFLSPCILPMVPVYLAYLSGQTVTGLAEQPPSRGLLVRAFWFVAGFTLVYAAMGATASAIGSFLTGNRDLLIRLGGGLMILLGVVQFGLFPIPQLQPRVRQAEGWLSALLLGMTLAVAWTGCTAPALMFVLTLAGGTATLWQGVGLLVVYALAMGIPFLLIAVCYGVVWGKVRRGMRYLPLIQKLSAGVMILFGLTMVLGWFTRWVAALSMLQ